jgi:DNA-binding NarL/FixJ family response regulator
VGFILQLDDKALIQEIRRIANECRLQSRGLRPGLALMRTAASLNSLAETLKGEVSEESPLTKREEEILFYVSQGYTNREIASALNISEKTIEFHLKTVFQKTEADGRTEAVKNALTRKWISP